MGQYLRQHQVDEIENEKKVIERTLTNQRDVQDRGNLLQHIKGIDRDLAVKAPPDLTGEDRDRVVRECQEIEGRLQPLMPSDEQMRRNTPGTVGQHLRFDKAAKSRDHFKDGDLSKWKDNQLALNKGSDDPDVANFERMRPLHNHGSMEGAQIPGTQYHGTNPSQAYLDGHDRTFGDPEPSPEDPVPARKKATRKKAARASGRKPQKMSALACGKMMGTSGRHFHVAKCETCQEAAKE